MRTTVAQRHLALAVIAPIAAVVVGVGLLTLTVLIRGKRWPHDSIVPDATWGVAAFVAIWSSILFAAFALVSAKPRGAWAREAQHVVMNLVACGLLVIGLVSLFALATWTGPLLGLFLPALPLGVLIAYHTRAREDPQATPRRFLRNVGVFVLVVFVGAVALVVLANLSLRLGGDIVITIVGLVIAAAFLLIIGLGALSILINWSLRWWFKLRTGKATVFALAFFLRLHRWQPMARDGAEERWRSMHGLPVRAELVEGRTCRDCPVIALTGKGAQGESYLILERIHIDLSVAWIVGVFVRSALDPGEGGNRRRSIALFDRPGCRWMLMSRSRLGHELSKRGDPVPSSAIAECWACRDCSTIRLDCVDAEQRPVVVFMDAPEAPIPEWYAGLLFAFNEPMGLPIQSAEGADLPTLQADAS